MQKRLLLINCFVVISVFTNAQILINNTITAQQMVQSLVGNGIQISNVTLTAPAGSYGYFNRNGSTIRLDSGIVLTTGKSKTTGGIRGLDGTANNNASNTNNAPGDNDLNSLVTNNTNDACVLEFDFVPTGDSINFRYIFSSEEYPDYNCSEFNDVFAFFISGPGITGQRNLALVPGTNIPVTINSVNNGIVGSEGMGTIADCTSMGPGSPFTHLFVDNSTSTTVTHNGFTVILTAGTAVQPCATYHIKLAIADVSDGALDSGVFLEAGSFSSSVTQLESLFEVDASGINYLAEGCNTGSFKVKLPQVRPVNTIINLQYVGTAVRGVDYNAAPLSVTIPAGQLEAIVNLTPTVDNIAEGNEPAKIYLLSSCSNGTPFDSLTFEIRDYDELTVNPKNIGFCPTGGNNAVQLQVSGSFTTYSWTPPATLSNPSIANPIATPTGNITYIVTTQLGNCNARDSVIVRTKRITSLTKKNIFCNGSNDGFIHMQGNPLLAYPLQFSINNGPLQADSNFNNLGVGTYTVSIHDNTGCRLDSVVTLTQAFPTLGGSTTTSFANCNGQGGGITVTATGGLALYEYSLDGVSYQQSNIFTNTVAGNYTVYIRDANNCIVTVPTVVNGDPPITTTLVATAASCSGNADGSITVTASGGSGTYQYLLLGGSPQNANVLTATSGTQSVVVRDNTGCFDTTTVVVPLNNTATVNARMDTTICQGQSVTLTTVSNGTAFNWQPNATLNNATALSPVATPPSTTQYFVTATLGICNRTDSVTVIVLPAPTPNAGPDTAVCFGAGATLRASGGVQYSWAPPEFLSATNIANPVAAPTATKDYWVMVRDANGCQSLRPDTVKITIFPAIDAFAGRDTVVAINQPVQLQATGSTNYVWMPPTGLNNPNIANPIATLQNDIMYLVTVSDAIGCKDTASIRIKVYLGPEIYVPNAFSPNGDGRNDVLRAIVIGFKSFDYFTVFNRWGQRIFTTSDYRRGWDGTFNGFLQNQGNYVWMARGTDYKGNVVERRGSSILIR